uniref:BACON domain-containing protein n=1 Tax=Solibacter usitatus (strain Ellin6076) TaxID=234267 RepID=Q028E5_SOLUE
MHRSLFGWGVALLVLARLACAQSIATANPNPLRFTVVLQTSNFWSTSAPSGGCLENSPVNSCSQNLTTNKPIGSFSVRQVTTAKSAQWISNSSIAQTSSTTLKVTVNVTNLPKGDYLALLTIGVPGTSNSPIAVPIEFHVFPTDAYFVDKPAITTPGSATFTIASAVSKNKFSGTLAIMPVNPPTGNLVMFADAPSSTTKIISGSPTTADPNKYAFSQTVTVSASGLDASTLPNGASAYIYFSDSGGTGSTEVAVLLATLVTDTSPVAFSYSPGGSASARAITISSNYPSPLTFTPSVTSGASAFSVSVAAGGSSCATPCKLNVSAKSGLTGSFQGTLTLTPSSQGALPLAIPLSLSAGGTLSISPNVLEFHLPAGSTTPPTAQQVTVFSTAGSVPFTIQSDSWVVPDHSSGTTGAPSATVNVTLNPSGIPPGNPALGQFSVSSTMASNQANVTVEAFLTNSFTAPSSMSFSQGGPTSQNFNLGSAGASISFNIQSDSPWLRVSPTGGATPLQITVTVNAANLSANTHTGNLTVSDLSGSVQPVTIPVSFTVAPPPSGTLVIAHAADGNGFRTAVLLTNSDASAAQYTLQFHGEDGNPPPGRFELEAGSMTGTILPGKSVTIRTAGLGTQTVQGWAEVAIPATVGVGVIYSQRGQGAVQEGTATIGATGTQHFFLPFDNTNGAVTAAAITNAGTAAASSVTVTLRYDDGTSETVPWGSSMAARSHRAFTMPQQFSHSNGKSGVAEFNSDQPLYSVVFRFNSTQAFTALDTLAAGAQSGQITRAVAHAADGNSFKTAFLLTNTDTATATYTLRLYGEDGNPPPARFELQTGTLTGTIPPGKSVTIRTAGLGTQTAQGWAELVAPGTVGGSVIYSQPGVGAIQEGTAPIAAPASQHFFLPFDNTNGAVTGAAITNAGIATVNNVTITLRYDDGTSETVPWGSTMAARSHRAFVMSGPFPHSSGRSGVAEFVSDQPLSVIVFRFNSTAAFTALGVASR